jgi:hypothetical protein
MARFRSRHAWKASSHGIDNRIAAAINPTMLSVCT